MREITRRNREKAVKDVIDELRRYVTGWLNHYAISWRMVGNSIVQRALTNEWLHVQGVPDMRKSWIVLHYGPKARV